MSKKTPFQIIFIGLMLFFCIGTGYGQLSGSYTVPSGAYPDLASIVTALNTQGLGASSVTIDLVAGNPQTAPSGGYKLGSTLLNASISAAKTITINGNSNMITANSGLGTLDAIFYINGTDYVTINGLNLQDNNAVNTTAPLAMEWGYAILNLNATAPFDGSQHITIQNCSITLNRVVATPTRCIYSAHHTTASATALVLTSIDDTHSFNKFYGNNLSNCVTGVLISGNSAIAFYDQNNDIGGTSAATGNTITNCYGTNYTGIGAIVASSQQNTNVSFNTIDQLANGGVPAIGGIWGIYLFGTNSTFTINNNNIKMSGAAINTAYYMYGIYGNAAGTTFTVQNNTLNLSEVSGSPVPCYATYLPNGTNLTYNNNSITQTQSLNGTTYGLFTTFIGNVVISGNTVKQTSTAVSTGQFFSLVAGGNAISETITNNVFDNTNVSFPGSTSVVTLIYTGNNTGNKTISGNSINGTLSINSSSVNYLVYNAQAAASLAGTATITNNNFSNITREGTGAFNGIYYAPSIATVQNIIISNNTISNVTSTSSSNFTLIAIAAGASNSVQENTIHTLSTNGSIFGIYNFGLNTNLNIFKNKLYNLVSNGTTTGVYGISVAGGTNNNIYNNYVGHLTAPNTSGLEAIRGISLISSVASSNVNVYYNTILLDGTSSGTDFSTSGIFHTSGTSGTAVLDMRNNLVINNSVPTGTGISAAFRRSSAVLDNFAAVSNNNLLYAGTPSSTHLIMYDGTNSYQTLASYQAAVAPRETASVTENTNFISLTGSSPDYLHVSTAFLTLAESGGVNIGGISDDYDGNIRQGNPGYVGGGTAPDIGADEFNLCNTVTITDEPDNSAICAGQNTSFTVVATNGNFYQWQVNTGSGFNDVVDGGVYSGAMTSVLTITGATALMANYTYQVLVRNTAICPAVTSQIATLTINLPPVATAMANPNPVCPGSTLNLSSSGGGSYSWSGPLGFTSTLQNPTITSVTNAHAGTYTVTVTNGCGSTTASVVVVVAVGVSPTINATPNPICVNGTLNLSSTGGDSYAWSGPNSFTSTLQNPTIAGVTAANAGLYSVTVSTVSCGSGSASITVIVNPLPTATSGATPNPLCSGTTLSLSSSGGATYAWSGPASFTSTLQNPTRTNTVVAHSGLYTVTVTSAAGCTATSSVNVTVNQTPTATATATPNPICSGGTVTFGSSGGATYAWSGPGSFTSTLQNPTRTNVTVAQSGIYTVTVTSANGCSSTATVTLVVNPAATATAGATPNPVCIGSALNLTSSGGSTYAWSGPAGFTSTLQNPVRNITGINQAGVYNVTVTSTGGCIATASVNVAVSALPVAAITATPNPVCIGSNLQLGASGGVLYSWSGPASFSSNIQNPVVNNFQLVNAGSYSVTVTTASGCSASVSKTVTTIDPPIALATFDLNSACAGSELKLHGSGAGSYSWTGPAGFTSNKQHPSIANVTASNSGVYILTVTSPNGCTATSSISVTIVNPPVVSANPALSQVCEGSSLQLTASGTGNFSWSGPYGWASSFQNPVIDNIPSYLSGTYTVQLTGSTGCSSTASVEVKVYDHIKAEISATPNPVCEGSSLQLSASGGSNYIWNGPAGFNSNESNPRIDNINPKQAGIYYVYITNAGGCQDFAQVKVDVIASLSKATASATPNPVLEGGTVQFVSSDGFDHSWVGPQGFTSTIQNPVIKKIDRLQGGVYIVTIINEMGCPSIAKVNLRVLAKTKNDNFGKADTGEAIDFTTLKSGVVYPNPTTDHLYLDVKESGSIDYMIFDVRGNNVQKLNSSSNSYISTADLSGGVYQIVYKTSGSNEWLSARFVKIN